MKINGFIKLSVQFEIKKSFILDIDSPLVTHTQEKKKLINGIDFLTT